MWRIPIRRKWTRVEKGILAFVLLLIIVVGLRANSTGLLPVGTAPPKTLTCPRASVAPTVATWLRDRAAVLCLINNQRLLARVPVVKETYSLDHGANIYVARMVSRHFFSHTDPTTGRTFEQRFVGTGYTAGATVWTGGENLGWGAGNTGSPESIVKAWSASRIGHRDLMLDPTFRNIGIGVAPKTPWNGYGGTYVVDFGYRSPPLR